MFEDKLIKIQEEIEAFVEAKVAEIEAIEYNEDASDDEVDRACDLRYALQRAQGVL